MPTTETTKNRRLPGSVLVQQSAIEQASSLLQQLPEKPREVWSLREAIDQLQDSITSALDRGYSHEEVAEMLADKGIKISVSSLKRYLAATKRDATPGAPKMRRTRRPRRVMEATDATPSDNGAAPAPVVTPPEAEETPAEPAPKRRGGRTPGSGTKTAAKAKATSTRTKTPAAPKPTTTRRGRKKAQA